MLRIVIKWTNRVDTIEVQMDKWTDLYASHTCIEKWTTEEKKKQLINERKVQQGNLSVAES